MIHRLLTTVGSNHWHLGPAAGGWSPFPDGSFGGEPACEQAAVCFASVPGIWTAKSSARQLVDRSGSLLPASRQHEIADPDRALAERTRSCTTL